MIYLFIYLWMAIYFLWGFGEPLPFSGHMCSAIHWPKKKNNTRPSNSLELALTKSVLPKIKRATRCTKAPAYAGSRKGSHHFCCIVCSLTLFFTQEAVFRTRTHDLSVTWQQLYQLRQGYPLSCKRLLFKKKVHYKVVICECSWKYQTSYWRFW